MTIPQKNIDKWREDWTKVVQVKRTVTHSRDRKTYDDRTTEIVTISIAKQYEKEAEKILTVVSEILKRQNVSTYQM